MSYIYDYNKYKVYQIKDILEQFFSKNPEKKETYKSKPKKLLIEILKKNKIDMSKYNILQNNPKPYVRIPLNPLKKYGKDFYSEEQQKNFMSNLKKNKRHRNPLQPLNKYIDKEGNLSYINLQDHQTKFVKQFVYSNLRGAVAYHGVGSGKTLTAVVASYFYNKIYENTKVIVISPSALLYNFINGMIQYGLDIQDNRFKYYTYERFVRNPYKPLDGENVLLIVDEAHNLRTQFNIVQSLEETTSGEEVVIRASHTNKRGFKIFQFSEKYDKVMFLTGTAFVNGLYDIENLIAMVDKRSPIDKVAYGDMLTNTDNLSDYFSYRISYYKSPKSPFFPERIDKLIPIYMSSDVERQYDKIKADGPPERTSDSENPNAFYSAEKYASNMIKEDGINPKVKWIIDEIRKKPNQKFIIYSGLFDAGVQQIKNKLDNLNIGYKEITGRQSVGAKEDSKKFFNFFNFGNNDFFDKNTLDPLDIRYINDKYRILLITRAGAEGVDTINCQNMVLVDELWNDATAEQIIARAIRFKSHFGLPEKERYVNVYKLLLVRNSNKKLVDLITQPNFNGWVDISGQINEATKEFAKFIKIENNQYIPQVQELKKLTIATNKGQELFIPEITEYKKQRGQIGKKSTIVQITYDGWDKYKKLEGEEARKKWRKKAYNYWFENYSEEAKKSQEEKIANLSGYNSMTVDLRLLIVAKAKQQQIENFIQYFGNKIDMFEDYQSKILPLVEKFVKKYEAKYGKKLSENVEPLIYKRILNKYKIDVINNKLADSAIVEKIKKSSQVELQQYFTNEILAEYIIRYSSITKRKETEKIDVLEPTAGVGNLIKPVLKIVKADISIDLCEIDNNNRNILREFVDTAPNILNLLDTRNFLRFIPSKRYDYIFMNPPFHIKKSTSALLKRDIWDFDFVKRAFAMLKLGGELIAITSKHWTFADGGKMKEWMEDDNNKKLQYEIREKEDFGKDKETGRKILMDIVVLKLIKTSDVEDNEILSTAFYNDNERQEGQQILNNERDIGKEEQRDKQEAKETIPEQILAENEIAKIEAQKIEKEFIDNIYPVYKKARGRKELEKFQKLYDDFIEKIRNKYKNSSTTIKTYIVGSINKFRRDIGIPSEMTIEGQFE